MAGKPKKSQPGKPLDDAALLEIAFADVTPLPGRKIGRAPPPSRKSEAKPRAKAKPAPAATAPNTPPAPAPPPLPELMPGDAAGVDRRTAQRLRRGKMDIEGRLDLHGLTQDKAFAALESFLTRAQGSGKRCVLVITGKGRGRETSGGEGAGVLKEAVPKWFNRPGLRERVLSFRTALPRDGGDGALYVLLRRVK